VVIADPDPPQELLRCVIDVGASPALYLGREFTLTTAQGYWQANLQSADGGSRQLPAQPSGALLPENICAAAQAALLLGVEFSDDCFARALARAAPVGRRQERRVAGREYVLDVAHNPASVRKLLDYLSLTPCNGKTICVFSIMADKDIPGIVNAAAGHFDAWFLADQHDNKRAASAADIAELLGRVGPHMVSVSKNLRQAFRRAQSIMTEGDRMVVFGSFSTVAGVLPLLEKDNNKREAQ
jgi:dihydrofolate synthase/folylpolyglutamate synthase